MIELVGLDKVVSAKATKTERVWGVKYFPVKQGCPQGWKRIGSAGRRVKCIPESQWQKWKEWELEKRIKWRQLSDDIEISGLEQVPPQVVTAVAPSAIKAVGKLFRRKKKKAPAPAPAPTPAQPPAPETGLTKYLPYIGIGIIGLLAIGMMASRAMGEYDYCPC
ncbi:MAG: hypothetical protein QW156_04615 [Candidatus Aenigmatarchaeota archaeon]